MQASVETTDQGLLSAIQEGSQGAFERLFRAHYSHLAGFACNFLKDPDSAEELVQDVFTDFWQKRQELQINGTIKSYLFGMVRNRCINRLKQEQVRSSYSFAVEEQTYESANDPLEANELALRIDDALDQLPEQRQIIFRMSREEGLKYREIADQLGLSIKTVENQMGKALQFLRNQLQDYLPLILAILFFFIDRWG